MKFLADEHIEFSVIAGLKQLGIDVIAVDEVKRSLGDEDIIKFAGENRRVVITRDSDFLRLHAKGMEHSGILFITKFLPIGVLIREIEKVALVFEGLENTVIFIPMKGA